MRGRKRKDKVEEIGVVLRRKSTDLKNSRRVGVVDEESCVMRGRKREDKVEEIEVVLGSKSTDLKVRRDVRGYTMMIRCVNHI